jgi:hypothetical protein
MHSEPTSSYQRALQDQPRQALLPAPLDTIIPFLLFAIGQTFVVTSTWALGITGTFLGDYFGILMDARVEGFPFNVLRDPMYVGSTMCFAATALWYERPAGLVITAYVYIVYVIALRYEGYVTFSFRRRNEGTHWRLLKTVHGYDLLQARVLHRVVFGCKEAALNGYSDLISLRRTTDSHQSPAYFISLTIHLSRI